MSHFKAKCTQFDLGWGCAPKPTQGVLPRSSIAGYNGTAFKGREESEREGVVRKGRERGEIVQL